MWRSYLLPFVAINDLIHRASHPQPVKSYPQTQLIIPLSLSLSLCQDCLHYGVVRRQRRGRGPPPRTGSRSQSSPLPVSSVPTSNFVCIVVQCYLKLLPRDRCPRLPPHPMSSSSPSNSPSADASAIDLHLIRPPLRLRHRKHTSLLSVNGYLWYDFLSLFISVVKMYNIWMNI